MHSDLRVVYPWSLTVFKPQHASTGRRSTYLTTSCERRHSSVVLMQWCMLQSVVLVALPLQLSLSRGRGTCGLTSFDYELWEKTFLDGVNAVMCWWVWAWWPSTALTLGTGDIWSCLFRSDVCAAGARPWGQQDGRGETEARHEAGNSSVLRSHNTLA